MYKELNAYTQSRAGAGVDSIAIYDPSTGATYTAGHTDETFSTASVVKLTIMIGIVEQAQNSHRSLTSIESSELSRMISISDNDAASALWAELGGASGVQLLLEQIGAKSTTANTDGDGDWGLTQTTATDQLKIMRTITEPNSVLDDAERTEADLCSLRLRRHNTEVCRPAANPNAVLLKNGWLPENGGWDINSVGYVDMDHHIYDVAVLTNANPSEQYGIDAIEGLSGIAYS